MTTTGNGQEYQEWEGYWAGKKDVPDQPSPAKNRQMEIINKQLAKFSDPLGDFIAWQVYPSVFELFQEWGFDFYYISSGVSVHREAGFFDIDVFAASDSEAILIAVKTRLNQGDVDEHLQRLAKFKRLMPRFRDVKALGAVAAMVVPDEVASYAYRQGLFVLVQSGENVIILNDGEFTPQVW
ncbi:MAG: DUF3782 domain-containing protein [Microcystaceae cyanobacterium]